MILAVSWPTGHPPVPHTGYPPVPFAGSIPISMSFADLGLSPETLKAVAEVGYTTPTPIQEQAIPWVLMGRDVMGIAQTGTGKTASFTLPMIDILANGRAKARMPRSLIIAPTRELANQAAENFTLYGKYHKLSMALLIGGESFTEQEKALDRGVDVLIATPGRLLDLFERGRILLRDVKVLVIDEADRMLDMGFIPDVERIVSLLPPLRQTLFFSATMDDQISRLADAFLTNPKEVRVARQATTAETVTQLLAIVDDMDKRETLRHILRMEDVRNAFIFCNRKRDVDILYRSLRKHGFDVAQLHGDMPQSERTATLASFKAGNIRLLVCSDVAARGLDIADVSHVFNFDVPHHPEDYVHRIGRTGRAGREGKAYTIASADDGKAVIAIEKLIGKEIPRLSLEGLPQVAFDESGEGRRRRSKDRPERSRGEKDRSRGDKSREDRPREDRPKAERVRDDRETGQQEMPVRDGGRDETRNSAKDNTVARDGKDRDRGERNDRNERADRPERNDRPERAERTDRSETRGDRPERGDRDRNDRDRGDRDRNDRDRGDRRNDRRRRDSHPALDVPEMTFGDDVLAFGGQTPSFMLAPLTLTEELALRPRPLPKPVVEAEATQTTDAGSADEAPARPKRSRRRRGRGGDDGAGMTAEDTPWAEDRAAADTAEDGHAEDGHAEDGHAEDDHEVDHADGDGDSARDSKPRRPAKTSARIAKKLSKKQVSPASGDAPAEQVAEEPAAAETDTPVTAPASEVKPPRKRPSRAKAKAADTPDAAPAEAGTGEPEAKPAKTPAKPRPSRAKAAKAEAPAGADADSDAEAPKKPARRRTPRKAAAEETPAAEAPASSEGSSEG